MPTGSYRYSTIPLTVSIETYCYCNARCIFCGLVNSNRNRGAMSRELFHKIIDEISTWNRKVTIGLSVYGEPFLNPDWLHFMQYVSDKAPLTKLTISTNGSVFDDNVIDEIVKFNNIEELGFSLYAFYPDTYKRIMGLTVKTMDNIEHAIERISKERPDIVMDISYTEDKGYMDSNELELFKMKWGKHSRYPHPMVYNYQHDNRAVHVCSNVPCQTMFTNLSILHDGRVNLCCFDARGEIILGDVNKNTLLEVWHGEQFKIVRDIHATGFRSRIPLCCSCNYGYSAKDLGLKMV